MGSCVGATAPWQFLAPQQPPSCPNHIVPLHESTENLPVVNIQRNKSTQTFDNNNSHIVDFSQTSDHENQAKTPKSSSVNNSSQVQKLSSATQTTAPKEEFIFSVYDLNTTVVPPVIRATLAKLDYNFLVDSGSSISLISAELFNSLKSFLHYKYLSRNVVIKTVNSSVKFLGCAEISFTINRNFFRHPFFLVDLSQQSEFQGLLGTDFLHKNAVTVDFQNSTLNFKDQKIPFYQREQVTHNNNVLHNLNLTEDHSHSQNILENALNFSNSEENDSLTNNSVEALKNSSEPVQNPKVPNNTILEAKFQNKVFIHPHEERYATLTFDTPHNMENFAFESILDDKCVECPYALFSNNSVENQNYSETKNISINVLIKNLTDKSRHFNKGQIAGHVYEIDDIQELELPIQKVEHLNLITANDETLNLRKQEFNLDNFNLKHLQPQQASQIQNLLARNWSVFSSSLKAMGHTDHVIPEINFTSNFPRRSLPYPIPQKLQAVAKKQLDEMKEAGIISSTISDWACPLLLVKKKLGADGIQKYRLALDLRLVNAIITQSAYPLPKIQDIISNISEFKFYTNLDLHSAYNQINLPEEYRQKLAFNTPFGTFQFNRLVFGLKNSASIFQALMNKILDEVNIPGIFAYQDDLVVASNSLNETLDKLNALFECLKKYNLTLSPTKCNFHQDTIDYLGFRISQHKIEPIQNNITKITEFATPKNKKHLKRFLGLCSFYRCLISKFAERTVILNNLTTPKALFKWDQHHENAFRELQKFFFMRPFLRQPDWDKKFYLNTDASSQAIAACLLQEFDGQLFPISYFSKTLSKSEGRYPAIKKELMAIIKGVQAFKYYLYNRHFVILSDSLPLKHFRKTSSPADLTTRWLLQLDEYSYTFQHIPGHKNALADYFSRLPESPHKESLSNNPDIVHSEEVLPIEEVSQHSQENDTCDQVNAIQVSNENQQSKDPLLEVSVETLFLEQQKDQKLRKIYNSIKEKKPSNFNKYFYVSSRNSLLHFDTSKSDNPAVVFTPKIVIPSTLIPKVIRIAHVTHLGVQKTYQLLQKNYWWKGMFKDTQDFVNSCDICLQVKPQRVPQAPFQSTFLPSHPSEMISLDLVGPFSNNFHILTVIDIFSRHMELYPVKNVTAGKVAEKIFKYICAYGRPAQILTDLGSQFNSAVFHNLNEVFQINLMHCSSGHPQANGISERINSSIKATIQALQCEGKTFFHAVDLHKSIYNGSVHPSTGFSPNLVHFSRELSLITDLANPDKMSPVLNISQTLHEIFQAINQVYSLVYGNLQYSQQLSQSRQQKFKKLRQFSPGNIVYIKPVKKFSKKLDGPFEVVKRISPVNYSIRRMGNSLARESTFHVDRLVLSQQRPRRLLEEPPVQSSQPTSAADHFSTYPNENPLNLNNCMLNNTNDSQFFAQESSSSFTVHHDDPDRSQQASGQQYLEIPQEPDDLSEQPRTPAKDVPVSPSSSADEPPVLSPQPENHQNEQVSMPTLSPVLLQSSSTTSVSPGEATERASSNTDTSMGPTVDEVSQALSPLMISHHKFHRTTRSRAKQKAVRTHQYNLRSHSKR